MRRCFSTILCFVWFEFGLHAQEAKYVALVFDDGPTPETATRLLTVLEEAGVRASFAQVASNVEKHTELSLKTQSEGHEIVNHSYDHQNVDDLSDEELEHEISGAQKKISELLNRDPIWYWPPFLKVNDRVRSHVEKAGIALFEPVKTVVTMDYDRTVGADEIEEKATNGVVDGSVILFHEWRSETVDRLPSILNTLRDQNCKFVTFSELAERMK
ncbi:MAG: peptidoglycan/xylan/chitin deacetylase (PgdA/CDA1 family) [Candidatus Pelagisphaera sp.]|jgi:peptidoglycan/xylan/chitin deacetylase (PgdA/CDA1 family)